MERSSEPLFSWLHLSDIHFGHGQATEHEHRRLVLEEFLHHLRRASATFGTPTPNALFITGDVGFSGDALGRREYAQAEEWLLRLTHELGLKPHDAYLVPGNHDVARVREEEDAETFGLLQHLRTGEQRLDDVLADARGRALLAGRLEKYLKLAASFGPGAPDVTSRQGLVWSRKLKAGNLPLRIAGLNTALLANDDSDKERLWLGLSQLSHALLPREEDTLVIALSHHPPDWLGDRADVERWLKAGAVILLSGHTHDPNARLIHYGGGQRFLHISAGALHEVPMTREEQGLFAFSFGAVSRDGEGELQLQVWPFLWTKNHEFRPDQNQTHPGRHYALFSLKRPSPAPIEDPEALETALEEYKHARAEKRNIRLLDLRGLAGISSGEHQTELPLLDIAVAPSLLFTTREQEAHVARLRRQLEAPELDPTRKQELIEQLDQLQADHWGPFRKERDRETRPLSFAKALRHHKHLAVIGDPGAGKSVLTRLAFLACTHGHDGDRARELLIQDDVFDTLAVQEINALSRLLPVHLSLGDLGGELAASPEPTLEELIRRRLHEHKASSVLVNRLEELLTTGRLFLLCDGLDEVAEKHRRRTVDAVSAFVERYASVRLLLTSRPSDNGPRVPGLSEARLAPLHPRQQRTLVSGLHRFVETHRQSEGEGLERARHRTNALLHALRTRKDWSDLGSNPLLLTLSALTPTDDNQIPKHRVFVFENFVRTILGQWRTALSRPREEAEQLLQAWSSVASKLLRTEQLRGLGREPLLELLTETLAETSTTAPLPAKDALHLALETGLVRENDQTIGFWHLTFAEFLAARALTVPGLGAAKRLLAEPHLPPLVSRLAAARLDHVLGKRDEVTLLMEGLLARDEHGAGGLLRTGLRAVSECLADGVRVIPALSLRVWTAWAELLEKTPPSPPWRDFGRLTTSVLRLSPPASLVERFARIEDQGVKEVREGLARLVASGLADAHARKKPPEAFPSALSACERWLKQSPTETPGLHGAFGLASATPGAWSVEVITALGRFGAEPTLDPKAVGELVRRGGRRRCDQLRELVRTRPGQEQTDVLHQRLSAASLLAVAEAWDDTVAELLKQALAGHPLRDREKEAAAVVRHCHKQRPVREALLEWIGDASILGGRAREVVRDVAPLIEGMPEDVLRKAVTAEGKSIEELEKLLSLVGEERRTFTDTLRRWLADDQPERRMCAARILSQLAPDDERLHVALQRGMSSSDGATRVLWARQALSINDRGVLATARKTLLECARSPERRVRELLYVGLHGSLKWLGREWLDSCFDCAADGNCPAEARLDAVEFVGKFKEWHDAVVPSLRELLDAEDAAVRLAAANHLLLRHQVDARVAAMVMEQTARACKGLGLLRFEDVKPYATTVVPAILRGLSREPLPDEDSHSLYTHTWSSFLAKLVNEAPSFQEDLLNALDQPGLVGDVAADTLSRLMEEHVPVREALRARIERVAKGTNPLDLFRLIGMGLEYEETRPAILEAIRGLDTRALTQQQLERLAERLYAADAEEDAARLWRLLLEGDNLELALQAAEALVARVQEAHARLQPATLRILGSPEPSHRVDAARLALWCGFLEEQALEALFGCLELVGPPYKRGADNNMSWRFDDAHPTAFGPSEDRRFDELRPHGTPRIDFEAMHALCVYRPALGLPRLATWLEDDEVERFTRAVKLLAERSEYREPLRAALEHRVRSGPAEQLRPIASLVKAHGFCSMDMVELLLARYTPKQPGVRELEDCLSDWLREEPQVWSVLRRQPPERHRLFWRLAPQHLTRHPDAISLAVDFALSEPGEASLQAVYLLKQGCSPQSPDRVRTWLREALEARTVPNELSSILLFEQLAALGGMTTDRRLEILRRVLTIDVASIATRHEQRMYLLQEQVDGVRRMLELGSRDERIQPLLESAVHTFAEHSSISTFVSVRALMKLRPIDEALRASVVRAVIAPDDPLEPNEMLDLLGQVGLSREECIDVLIARLRADVRPSWMKTAEAANEERRAEAPAILDALEELGCPPERRTRLLLELLSQHAEDVTPELKLELAVRAELPELTAAKLLLDTIAHANDWKLREVVRPWLERFVSQRDTTKDEAHSWWLFRDSTYLPLRLGSLVKFSEVDDPELLETALAELATTPTPSEDFLELYHRAQTGDSLSDAEWTRLLDTLRVGSGEDQATLLAKEWLTLRLWQGAEPRTVDTLLKS